MLSPTFRPTLKAALPPVSDILTTGYISVHDRSPYFLCCYIYKFNIGTSDILTSLNILIEILIMIMQYSFFSFSINHNHPAKGIPRIDGFFKLSPLVLNAAAM
jgi:hypothetical protein